MALIFDSDPYHKKSRRHGTSGRRATTSYDKYGYQVANFGSSSFSTGTESVMHVLRVRPGVVVNVIDAPSSSPRSRTSSSHRAAEHKSSRKNSHSHRGDNERDSSWVMTHSPHPRALELFDERGTSNTFGTMEATAPSRDVEPITRRSPPSRHPTPEAHYATEPRDSPRRATVPIDVPINSHSQSSHHSDYSLLSPSISSSDSALFNYDNAVEPHYSTHRHMPTPIEMPMQISPSGRNFSRPFDFPSPVKPPSPTGSLPSNTRTVRFNEDPVLPSPALVPRRKGWWNKRGDQLWDNEGGYAPAPEHDKYPLDLHDYPEPGTGWVNEDGVQIDMKRRIVRKKPLRSALKKTSL